MDAPTRFGYPDVLWAPSPDDDPREVVATYLQHRIVLAVRKNAGSMSVREMAARANVSKSTLARWLAGSELLGISALGRLAAAFGLKILDELSVSGGADGPAALLPAPYRPLAVFHDGGGLTFTDLTEPAWEQLAAAVASTIATAYGSGSGHLLSAAALAWVVADAAHRLPPTRALVDIHDADHCTVSFGLEQPVEVTVALVPDTTAGQVRTAILGELLAPRVFPSPDSRRVVLLVMGGRGAMILDQLTATAPDGTGVISSLAMSRAGVGNPVDPDLVIKSLAGRTTVDGQVAALEIVKAAGD